MPATDSPAVPAAPSARSAWGVGLATIAGDGTVLDTWFPAPQLGSLPSTPAVDAALESAAGPDERRNVRLEVVTVEIDLDASPTSTSDAYLRLHLLSHLLTAPNTLNLDGIFGFLPNVVWTTAGPVHPADFRAFCQAALTASRSSGCRHAKRPHPMASSPVWPVKRFQFS